MWKVVSDQATSMRVSLQGRAADNTGRDNSANQELIRIDKQYIEAFNAGNSKALTDLYSENAQIYPANKDVIRGRVAIQQFWKEDLGGEKSNQTTEVLSVHVDGDIGHLAGKWTLSGEKVQRGKYLLLFKKLNQGWKIDREIWNEEAAK